MAVSDWSSTADDNTEINGISIAEHCPAKNINNAIRSVMAALKTKCDALDSTDNSLRRGAVIGEVRWFAMSTPPEGWLACNGAAVGTSDYPALFAAIGNTFLPEDVSASPATFNLPNLMGKVPWGSTSVGTIIEAGVPNINGDTRSINWSTSDSNVLGYDEWLNNSGPYTRSIFINNGEHIVTTFNKNEQGLRRVAVNFNASRSNSIYGRSDTVQPPALCLLPCIRYE